MNDKITNVLVQHGNLPCCIKYGTHTGSKDMKKYIYKDRDHHDFNDHRMWKKIESRID